MVNQSIKLTVGGDVQAANGTYLQRSDVDEQLFKVCLANQFTYVLASRQIGKSSLKNAIAERLINENIRVASIDLKRIGQIEKAELWYFSFLHELASNLQLEIDVETWWKSQPYLSTFTQRFLRFFDEIVLNQINQRVVIFIDEIDMTLNLPFSDDFFAAIRAVHNDRAQYTAYKRLTFVLLGVATPSELIKNSKRTPFNIGQEISISDFTKAECELLRLAIEENHPNKSEAYFEQIYDWTNGHPYLTQQLCAAVANVPQTDNPDLVDNLVQTIFLADYSSHNENIRFVQKGILRTAYASEMLRTYQKILEGKVVYDDRGSIVLKNLKLCGLVTSEKGILKSRNKIYKKIFNKRWIKKIRLKSYINISKKIFFYSFLLFILLLCAVSFLNY